LCKHARAWYVTSTNIKPISTDSPLWNVGSGCHRRTSDLSYIILCLGVVL
jgi:hypothetical protein